MILIVLAVIIAAGAIGGLVYARSTRADQTPLEPVASVEQPVNTDSAQQYEGASDAGAYQAGGAAYAQFVQEGAYGASAVGAQPAGNEPSLNAVRSRLADVADSQLKRSGHHGKIAAKLEAGGSKARPGEWATAAVGLVVAGVVLGLLLRNPIVAVVAGGLGGGGAWMWLDRKVTQRQKAFADQLPETLGMLASSLRGGMSMMQSIATIAAEAEEPTNAEFTRVITEVRLGRDLGVAFNELADRAQSLDFQWVVNAIDIHREVGGDLAVILDRLGDTIRARNRVLGQMKALSAEGRLSGFILFALPPAMVALISVLNREYLDEMTGTGVGIGLLILACVLLGIGGLWMKKLVKFRY